MTSVELSLPPMTLRDLAQSLGWVQVPEALPDGLFVLNHPDHPRRQLVFPSDEATPDAQETTARMLERLAELSHTPAAALYARAASFASDTLSLRVATPHGADQTLPLTFATTVLQSAQQLLRATTCTLVQPRLYHPRLSRSEANLLIESSAFEHTATGSFALNISCPLAALEGLPARERGDDTPFVRQVTLHLHRAVASLIYAVEADQIEGFLEQQRADPLVSANLCEALTQMHDERLENRLELAFRWSGRCPLPLPQQGALQRPLRIQRDYFERIGSIARALRPAETPQHDHFVGTVEALQGELDEEGRRAGEVTFSLLKDGESIRARATLNAADYALANAAHMAEHAYVRVVGTLHPGRQPRLLSDARILGQILNTPEAS